MVRTSGLIIILAAAGAFIFLACEADQKYFCNVPSACGKLLNISYPFRLKGDPPYCGDPRYELSCENNHTVLYMYSGKYYVEAISYENRTMRVVDSGLQSGNCSSVPLHSLTYFGDFNEPMRQYIYPYYYPRILSQENYVVFLSFENPIVNTDKSPQFVNTSPCFNVSSSSSGSSQYSYVVVGDLRCSDVPDSCTIGTMVPIGLNETGHHRSFYEIHHEMTMGFELSWFRIDCRGCDEGGGICILEQDHVNNNIFNCQYCRGGIVSLNCMISYIEWLIHSSYLDKYHWPLFYEDILLPSPVIIGKILAAFVMVRTLLGYLCFPILLIYMWRRRHFSMDANIEEFLQGHNNLKLVQYSYSEIKKMSKHFSDKLGKGGFGSVYKGKLRSGNLVGIKMLEKSKGNGQDFINEVSTIGRIHHVNVVQLVGFCFEGSKRALVYDFMPNGSLDKYLFTQEQRDISWEKMHNIALGVAHGIEYLHRGCDMQILHFDIKPHNVLLDEDFTPKISDFGLAKLYPTNDNTVSLTAARGTIGYIAPELVYKSMGGVSYKADVYSFGMLLMEMAGIRKNVNPFANTSSQVYFPAWIYDKLNQEEDIEMEEATDDEKKIARKMIIVALSCIQMKPVDRPSMTKVIEMLESPTELLQMPPKPFVASLERVEEDLRIIESTTSQSTSQSYNSVIQSNEM